MDTSDFGIVLRHDFSQKGRASKTMTQGARTADVCTRFSLMVRAIVVDRDAVSVTSFSTPSGDPVIFVSVSPADMTQIMGQGHSVAQALRTLLETIGERHGVHYLLRINGECFYSELQPVPEWGTVVGQISTSFAS